MNDAKTLSAQQIHFTLDVVPHTGQSSWAFAGIVKKGFGGMNNLVFVLHGSPVLGAVLHRLGKQPTVACFTSLQVIVAEPVEDTILI